MKKFFEAIKKTFAILGYISSIIAIVELIINFEHIKSKITEMLYDFDFYFIGQVIQILGLIVVVSGILIYMFLKVYNKFEPERSLAEIIAPLLLSKDVIGDSEAKFEKKLKLFKYIRIGVVILIIGFVIMIITRILK